VNERRGNCGGGAVQSWGLWSTNLLQNPNVVHPIELVRDEAVYNVRVPFIVRELNVHTKDLVGE